MNSIREVIKFYKPKIKEALNSVSKDYYKLNNEIKNEMTKIENAEVEIVNYFKEGIQLKNWEDERYWAWAAIVHPSDIYLEYFFKILETNDSSFTHWRILDVLAFMPEDLWYKCREIIERAIKLHNPSWCQEDLKKAFEARIWIAEENDDLEFIQQQCESEDTRTADMAKYWIEWLHEDEDEDEDD